MSEIPPNAIDALYKELCDELRKIADEKRLFDAYTIFKIKAYQITAFTFDDRQITGIVNSFTSDNKYGVNFSEETFGCGCKDFQVSKCLCKHILLGLFEAYGSDPITLMEMVRKWTKQVEEQDGLVQA